jgi:hypothetical protein
LGVKVDTSGSSTRKIRPRIELDNRLPRQISGSSLAMHEADFC